MEKENQLRLKQLELRGKLLSGFTHEIRNHLSIINESNGLLQDYLSMGQGLDPKMAERIGAVCAQIDKRIKIAAEMSQALNGFSHRTDVEISSFSANDFLEELLVFLKRYARLKEIDIATDIPEEHITLSTDPSLLQFLVTRIFFVSLEVQNNIDDSGELLRLSLQEQEHTVNITLGRKNGPHLEIAGLDIDESEQLALDKLHGQITIKHEDGFLGVTLSIPRL